MPYTDYMYLNRSNVIEGLGWYGVLAVVGAYGMLSLGMISANDLVYQLLNLTGALAIMIDAYKDGNMQPVVLNVVWAVIAVVGLWNVWVGW